MIEVREVDGVTFKSYNPAKLNAVIGDPLLIEYLRGTKCVWVTQHGHVVLHKGDGGHCESCGRPRTVTLIGPNDEWICATCLRKVA